MLFCCVTRCTFSVLGEDAPLPRSPRWRCPGRWATCWCWLLPSVCRRSPRRRLRAPTRPGRRGSWQNSSSSRPTPSWWSGRTRWWRRCARGCSSRSCWSTPGFCSRFLQEQIWLISCPFELAVWLFHTWKTVLTLFNAFLYLSVVLHRDLFEPLHVKGAFLGTLSHLQPAFWRFFGQQVAHLLVVDLQHWERHLKLLKKNRPVRRWFTTLFSFWMFFSSKAKCPSGCCMIHEFWLHWLVLTCLLAQFWQRVPRKSLERFPWKITSAVQYEDMKSSVCRSDQMLLTPKSFTCERGFGVLFRLYWRKLNLMCESEFPTHLLTPNPTIE